MSTRRRRLGPKPLATSPPPSVLQLRDHALAWEAARDQYAPKVMAAIRRVLLAATRLGAAKRIEASLARSAKKAEERLGAALLAAKVRRQGKGQASQAGQEGQA